MPSQAVILFQPSATRERKLPGRHGMFVQRPLLTSTSWASTLLQWKRATWRYWSVILMYGRSSTAATVDEARLDMFARKQRSYEAIPPTRAALLQHTRHAAFQAGCVWAQATQCQPEVESPADWGCQKVGEDWHVFWTANSPIAKSCKQLTKCGCKSGCCGRGKRYRLGLTCTPVRALANVRYESLMD